MSRRRGVTHWQTRSRCHCRLLPLGRSRGRHSPPRIRSRCDRCRLLPPTMRGILYHQQSPTHNGFLPGCRTDPGTGGKGWWRGGQSLPRILTGTHTRARTRPQNQRCTSRTRRKENRGMHPGGMHCWGSSRRIPLFPRRRRCVGLRSSQRR